MGKHFCLSAVFLNISADILVLATAPAHADVAISSASTQNMTCSAGICAPTSADAVLNNGDLETMLASGNVTIVTTGTGVQADNIDLTAAVDWTSSSTLTLDAYDSITFSATVKD